MTEVEDARPSFLYALVVDVDDAMRRQQEDDRPTNRRGLIRTLIAAVEGLAWIYREHVVGIARHMDILDESEKAALSETIFTADDSGRISKQRRFLSTAASIRLTSRIAKKCAPDAEADFGGEGWSATLDTIQLRNRITHPKIDQDLEISKDDIRKAVFAFHWFTEVIIAVMEKSNVAFRSHVTALSAMLELLKAGHEGMTQIYREVSEEPSVDP